MDLIWRNLGGNLYYTQKAAELPKLENAVYLLRVDGDGNLFLTREYDEFTFDYKIYGLETEIIERAVKSYEKTGKGNMGTLFNGIKGTGKTVSSKLLCNKLNQPVIIVNNPYKGAETFLNSIQQNITIFVDEYEKIYNKASDLLTIMDGVMNAEYRRFFILTTNQLRIEDNLLQRPSRLRYLKEFTHLKPSVVSQIVDDELIHKAFKDDIVKFVSSLQLITVDIVKSVIQEVNIHNEEPSKFGDVFNVMKLTGKFNVYSIDANEKETITGKNVEVYPRPDYDEGTIGYRFDFNNASLGRVTEVMGNNLIQITQYGIDKDGNWTDEIFKVHTLRIEKADTFHNNYLYDDVHGFGHKASKAAVSAEIKNDFTNSRGR